MVYRILSLVAVLSLLIAACSKDSSETPDLMEERITFLENVDTYGGKVAHANLVSAAADLTENVNALADNVTAQTLDAAKNAWRNTVQVFKQAELYEVGDVSLSFIHFTMYFRPIEPEDLESELTGTTPVTADYLQGLGRDVAGLGAIEYILYNEDGLSTLSTLENEPRRLDYLKEAAAFFEQNTQELEGIWNTYSPNFIVATESRTTGGQNQMLNALVTFLEETSNLQLGKALGEDNGGTIDQTFLEAHLSDASLDMIRAGFTEWKLVFSGAYPGSSDNYGFDDYLNAIDNETLVSSINNAISACDSELASFSSLNDALASNADQVESLQTAFLALNTLIRTDVASVIGATITVNITDGD
ncbi:MAG: imelysin family protein [Bacteroidota bacterium]